MLGRRKSTFLHGAEDDAREVVDELNGYLIGGSRVLGAGITARLRKVDRTRGRYGAAGDGPPPMSGPEAVRTVAARGRVKRR
jgi:hypothetical protein